MKIKSALLSTVAAASGLLALGATANAATVTVKSGDTVSKIARTHKTTISAIEKANHLKNVNLIYVGQQLTVNGDSDTTSATTSTTQASANTTTTQATTNTTSQSTTTASATNSSDSSAKAWIANKESGGSYSARNGQYIGKYQLSSSYLNGDYSAANQEKVANSYVASRYGSWSAAKAHWEANGWY